MCRRGTRHLISEYRRPTPVPATRIPADDDRDDEGTWLERDLPPESGRRSVRPLRITAAAHKRSEVVLAVADRQHPRPRILIRGERRSADPTWLFAFDLDVADGHSRVGHHCILSRELTAASQSNTSPTKLVPTGS